MSHQIVAETINAVVPCAHMNWPVDSPHPLPFAVYYRDKVRGMYADNKLYKTVSRWTVELHQYTRDAELEAAVEAAIAEKFGAYKINGESWIEDDQCYMVAYGFTEIEKEEDNG